MPKRRGPGNPNWKPGVSGNPSGKPQVRADAVYNAYTGHGTAEDRRSFTRHCTRPMLDEIALDLRRGNWIAKRICEWLPKECFRKGYTLKLDDKETAEAVVSLTEALRLNQIVSELGARARTVGGAALFPVLDGAVGDLSEPLDLDAEPRILGVRAIHHLERRRMQAVSYYEDITHPKYNKPSRYRVTSAGNRSTFTVIHESRLAIIYGDRVSEEDQPGQFDGWGDSKLTTVEEVIKDYGLAWGSAATILHNFSERIQAIEGLEKILAHKEGAATLLANLKRLDMLRSTLRTRVVSASAALSESAKSVSGLPDMLIEMAQNVCAAANMTMTRLFGRAAGGLNATGEGDQGIDHDTIATEQVDVYTPIVEWLIRLFLLSADGPTRGAEPDVWSIEWRPLKQQSESEIATTRKTVAETDQIYVDMGAPPVEIMKSRFGGDTYSMETTIDFDAVEEQIAAKEEAAAAIAEAAQQQQQPPPEDDQPADDEGEPA